MNRRAFLGTLAAVPLAARVAPAVAPGFTHVAYPGLFGTIPETFTFWRNVPPSSTAQIIAETWEQAMRRVPNHMP